MWVNMEEDDHCACIDKAFTSTIETISPQTVVCVNTTINTNNENEKGNNGHDVVEIRDFCQWAVK